MSPRKVSVRVECYFLLAAKESNQRKLRPLRYILYRARAGGRHPCRPKLPLRITVPVVRSPRINFVAPKNLLRDPPRLKLPMRPPHRRALAIAVVVIRDDRIFDLPLRITVPVVRSPRINFAAPKNSPRSPPRLKLPTRPPRRPALAVRAGATVSSP